MKRLIVPFLAVGTLLFLGPSLYAQHGRPSGTPGSVGAVHSSDASSHSNAGNAGAANSGQKTPDQLLNDNTKLSGNLQKLLPTGLTPQQACQNFKNLGRCVAAIHVSHNLGIDFNSLACDMTLQPVGTGTCATTPSKAMSLGASIDALKPGTNGKTEAQNAMKQANQTIKGSGS
jgi:hypothetical protein